MKTQSTILALLFLLCAANVSHAELNDLQKKYLARFGNYTGNLGIGFVPEHTFDYRFRQAIVRSKDEEVQKAFILDCLPREINSILHELKVGKKMIGKGVYEKHSENDRKTLLAQFKECMILLREIDGGKNEHFYSEYQSKLNGILKKK